MSKELSDHSEGQSQSRAAEQERIADIRQRQMWAAMWSESSRHPRDADDIRVLLDRLDALTRERDVAVAGDLAETFTFYRELAEAAEARAEALDAECTRLREAAQQMREFIRQRYPDDSLASGNWPTVKPLVEAWDAVLGGAQVNVPPFGGTYDNPATWARAKEER